MKIRQLQNQDLNKLIGLWNTTIIDYPITLRKLLQTLFCDDNYDDHAVMVAVLEEELLGFCIGIKRKYPYLEKGLQRHHGWILSMAVKPSVQQQGIGTALLKAVENYLDCSIVTLATYSPNYFFGGVDIQNTAAINFFECHGYQKNEMAFPMEIDFSIYQIPQAILHKKQQKITEGYAFRTFREEDGKNLLDFLRMYFSVGWRTHVIQAIRNETAYNTITLCTFHDEIVGYVQCAVDNDMERYGPFGVHPKMRNVGIGSILVHEMWQLMITNGANKAWFHSTDEAGKRFYERHGMHVVRELYHFKKGGKV